jgi:hypothetical protein
MLAMTLLVRDEIDLVDSHLDFHLPKVDLMVVTDNASTDGTLQRLRERESESDKLVVFEQSKHDFQQACWVNVMVAEAIKKGATWVVNSDVDEFWIGDIRAEIEVQQADGVNMIHVHSYFMRPTFMDDITQRNPVLRMVWREPKHRKAFTKVIHATRGFRKVAQGNYRVMMSQTVQRKEGFAEHLRILHYYEQGWSHFKKKYVRGGKAYSGTAMVGMGSHWIDKYRIFEELGEDGLLREYVNNSYVSDDLKVVQEGLVEDTSVRDALSDEKPEPEVVERKEMLPEEVLDEKLTQLEKQVGSAIESIKRQLNMSARWRDVQAGRIGSILQDIQVLRELDGKSADDRGNLRSTIGQQHNDTKRLVQELAEDIRTRFEGVKQHQDGMRRALVNIEKDMSKGFCVANDDLKAMRDEICEDTQEKLDRTKRELQGEVTRVENDAKAEAHELRESIRQIINMGFFRRLFVGKPKDGDGRTQ